MKNKLKTPFQIIAKVLNIGEDNLDENSAMYETPYWDSLNHYKIIVELESNYGIDIPNDDIEKYVKMKAIIELYETIQ